MPVGSLPPLLIPARTSASALLTLTYHLPFRCQVESMGGLMVALLPTTLQEMPLVGLLLTTV